MDFFDVEGIRKPTASLAVARLFRLIELCLAMVLFSWIFYCLPFAVTVSGHFLRQFAGVIASPLFVFLLCNAIIVTLIVKSQSFSREIPAVDNAHTLLYEELLQNHKYTSSKQLSPVDSSTPPPDATTEEIEFQDKEMIISQANAGEDGCNVVMMEISSLSDSDTGSELDSDASIVFRRCKSEKPGRKERETMKLRRSETEKFINKVKGKCENDDVLCPGEELSDEEFQRAVEDFIAKHLRFRWQESL